MLGWHPRMKVETALQWTVDWHKARKAGKTMHEFTAWQIDQFTAIADH